MKNFKEYLFENKKTYDFKIKVAGNLPEKFESTLKTILEKYGVANMSKSSTPVQKLPLDFPNLNALEVHIFEVNLDYPVISPVLSQYIVEKTGVVKSHLVIRSPNEPTEGYQEESKDGAYVVKLTSEMEQADPKAQDLVGEKHMMSFLKTLSKESHAGTQYKGINDDILAKAPPVSAKQEEMSTESADAKSILASKKVSAPRGMR